METQKKTKEEIINEFNNDRKKEIKSFLRWEIGFVIAIIISILFLPAKISSPDTMNLLDSWSDMWIIMKCSLPYIFGLFFLGLLAYQMDLKEVYDPYYKAQRRLFYLSNKKRQILKSRDIIEDVTILKIMLKDRQDALKWTEEHDMPEKWQKLFVNWAKELENIIEPLEIEDKNLEEEAKSIQIEVEALKTIPASSFFRYLFSKEWWWYDPNDYKIENLSLAPVYAGVFLNLKKYMQKLELNNL